MPAVQLDRLQFEINEAAGHIGNPAAFRKSVLALFEKYADHSYRPGEFISGTVLIPSYHITPLVLRQIEIRMSQVCRLYPHTSLQAADALWQSEYQEPRRLAALMLGQIPPFPPEPILQRIHQWVQPPIDPEFLTVVLNLGTIRLRRESPNSLIQLIESWINQVDPISRKTALKALVPLISDGQFENIPAIFRLISPLIQTAPSNIQSDLQDVIQAMASRSPSETAYFLRQILGLATSPATIRLIRRCLPYFSESNQSSLRSALATRTK